MVKEGGIRFDGHEYYGIFVEDDNIKLVRDIDGVVTEYDVTGGSCATGKFTLEMTSFPASMTAGDTYQIPFTVSEGATMEFVSSAPSSKISIDENGLMTCIGGTTGACGINIKCKNSAGDVIGDVHTRVKVG